MNINRYNLGQLPKKHWWVKSVYAMLPNKDGEYVEHKDVNGIIRTQQHACVQFTYSYLKYCRAKHETPCISGFRKWIQCSI